MDDEALKRIEELYKDQQEDHLIRLNPSSLSERNKWVYNFCNVDNVEMVFNDSDLFRIGGKIKIPVHEENSPSLTGEYVLLDYKKTPKKYYYYNSALDEPVGVSPYEFRVNKMGYLTRFWKNSSMNILEEIDEK